MTTTKKARIRVSHGLQSTKRLKMMEMRRNEGKVKMEEKRVLEGDATPHENLSTSCNVLPNCMEFTTFSVLNLPKLEMTALYM